MPEEVSAEAIYPSRLTHEARQRLSESLYEVHKRIFRGIDEKEFDHYVVNSPADVTKIFIYRNKTKKEIIGYFAVHRFEKFINDKPLVIFRAEAGLVPEYRHKNADISFWLKEATIKASVALDSVRRPIFRLKEKQKTIDYNGPEKTSYS